jgi:hypothetical protein
LPESLLIAPNVTFNIWSASKSKVDAQYSGFVVVKLNGVVKSPSPQLFLGFTLQKYSVTPDKPEVV